MTTITTAMPLYEQSERKDRNAADARRRFRVTPIEGVDDRFEPAAGSLVESDEYEWTNVMALPGLIVAPGPEQIVPPAGRGPAPRPGEHVIETEDGDAGCFLQLPGRLTASIETTEQSRSWMIPTMAPGEDDEYSDRAAMQMPGRLVEAALATATPEIEPEVRGLCATCVHQHDCDFPRSAAGVWRCEEYA